MSGIMAGSDDMSVGSSVSGDRSRAGSAIGSRAGVAPVVHEVLEMYGSKNL